MDTLANDHATPVVYNSQLFSTWDKLLVVMLTKLSGLLISPWIVLHIGTKISWAVLLYWQLLSGYWEHCGSALS